MPEPEFNPNSVTAQLATLIAKQEALKEALNVRLDKQDAALERIEAHAAKTNGRVTLIEQWRDLETPHRVACQAHIDLFEHFSKQFPVINQCP